MILIYCNFIKIQERMDSCTQKKNLFKVNIRRKKIQQKIAIMRTNMVETQWKSTQQTDYTHQKISMLVQRTLSNKENLIKNINSIKNASFHINQRNSHLFFGLVKECCNIISNIQQINQVKNNQDILYNDILITLINISSTESYQWPTGQYLPIIKNLINKNRQINTMWLLSNILSQRNSSETQRRLIEQLLNCHCIEYCEQRLNKTFINQEDINVFVVFVCCFLSNGEYLPQEYFKRMLTIIQSFIDMNIQGIDLSVLESMADYAPYVSLHNYDLLYSKIIVNFLEKYVKKKKSLLVGKFLQFIKIYIVQQIETNIKSDFIFGKSAAEEQSCFREEKRAKNNYERISKIIIPILTFSIDNQSPDCKSYLMEICCLLLTYYFEFIDLSTQEIYQTLAQNLATNVFSVLSKYSNKVIIWQLRLSYTLLSKNRHYKISSETIGDFIRKNKFIESFEHLVKEKAQEIEIVEGVTDLLILILQSVSKEQICKNQNQKNEFLLESIKNYLQIMLTNHMIKDEKVFIKIQKMIQLYEKKY